MTGEGLLSVAANLTIDISEKRVSVRADGRRVVVEFPNVSLVFRMMRDLRSTSSIRGQIAGLCASIA